VANISTDPIGPYFGRIERFPLVRSALAPLLLSKVYPGIYHPKEYKTIRDILTPKSPLWYSIQHAVKVGELFGPGATYKANTPAWYSQSMTSAGILTNSRHAGKILAAVANYGEIDGVCILKKETVKKMLAKPDAGPKHGFMAGLPFTQGGLLWNQNKHAQVWGCHVPPSVLASEEEALAGWAGAGGSWAFFSPGNWSISFVPTGMFLMGDPFCHPTMQKLLAVVSAQSATFKL